MKQTPIPKRLFAILVSESLPTVAALCFLLVESKKAWPASFGDQNSGVVMNSPLLRLSVLALSFASTSLPALAQQRWGMPFEGQDWWLSHFISRGFTGSGPHGPKWWAGFTGPSHPWKNHFSGGGSGGSTVGVGTGGGGGDGGYVTVPEIDASTGLLAIAAVLAALAFAWEIRRRRSLA